MTNTTTTETAAKSTIAADYAEEYATEIARGDVLRRTPAGLALMPAHYDADEVTADDLACDWALRLVDEQHVA